MATLNAAEQAMRASVGDLLTQTGTPAAIRNEIASVNRQMPYLSSADQATARQYVAGLQSKLGAGETAGVPAEVYTDAMGNSVGGASTDGSANHADTTKTDSTGVGSFFSKYASSAGFIVLGLICVGGALFMYGKKEIISIAKDAIAT